MEKPSNFDTGLHLFTGSGSPYARRVAIALREKNLAFHEHLLSFSNKDNKAPWFVALNPRGQVPLLVDDGIPLAQSMACLLYLEDKYPEPALLPQDPVLKFKAIAHVCEVDDKLYGDVEHDIFARGLKKDASEDVIKELNEKVDKELDVWEGYLAKNGTGFVVGSSLSIADVSLYPFLALVTSRLGLDLDHRSVPMPHLKAWVEMMNARDSVKESVPPHWKTTPPPAQPFAKRA